MTFTRASRRLARIVPVVASLAAVLTLVPVVVPAANTLSHLRGIEEVKRWFNAGQGHPRLIFLLSPT